MAGTPVIDGLLMQESLEKRIDILINNAVLKPMKSYNDPIENFRLSMKVNAVGVFSLTRVFAENMMKNRTGSIINIYFK